MAKYAVIVIQLFENLAMEENDRSFSFWGII